ncbi:GTP-binding protein Rit1-like isoform X2 [Tubulanus polymorphus]|uniref:GTP-binding protein Rit1-like isoform X2 n=1 Tax=Tubulanus polymorphus TaxID=672921 RepID=UPI003DA32A93
MSSQQGSSPRVYKIVIMGDGGVGKSALTMQFVCHRFLDYHDPTIEDAYNHQAKIDGEPAHLDILDTAGQPEFSAMREQYMHKGEGFILCYSITDRRSFDAILEYKKLIGRVRKCDDIPIVLVGNKYDLETNNRVTVEEGQSLARQMGCPFYETSAVLRRFVDDAFHSMVREIRLHQEELLAEEERNRKKKMQSKKFHRFLERLRKLSPNNSPKGSPKHESKT